MSVNPSRRRSSGIRGTFCIPYNTSALPCARRARIERHDLDLAARRLDRAPGRLRERIRAHGEAAFELTLGKDLHGPAPAHQAVVRERRNIDDAGRVEAAKVAHVDDLVFDS